jgi:YcxB-like protein
MKFEFEATFRELYWAALALTSRLPFLLAISMVFPVMGIALVVLTLLLGQPVTPRMLLLVVGCFVFTPGITALNVWLARRKNRTARGVHAFVMDDHGIHVSGATFDLDLKWAAIGRVLETKQFFFFMYSSRAAQFLPKRVIPPGDELLKVRNLIAENMSSRPHEAK